MAEQSAVPGLSKHFVDDPDAAVHGSLEATVLVNPTLVLDKVNKIVFRDPVTIRDADRKVSLVCGGGSGHEPAWAGFVGHRLLTAAVAGTVFASPSSEQVKACLTHRLPQNDGGILVIVKNYTGDVMNFGRAVEGARAMGKRVEMLVVGDDVGVGREKSGKVGRRGLAGAALVVKCCGALAELGESLDACARIGREVASNIVTVAVSLSRTHVLGRPVDDAKEEEARLPRGRAELGMGIHNEPGCAQIEADVREAIKTMLKQLLDADDGDRAYVDVQAARGDQVVLLVNNFGGLSNLELGAVTAEVVRQLGAGYALKPLRVLSGVFVGSLDGRGFSITLLKVLDTTTDGGPPLIDLLDAPTDCAAWPIGVSSASGVSARILTEHLDLAQSSDLSGNIRVDPSQYEKMLVSGLQRVVDAEPEITRYDSLVGDGDCGTGMKRGAQSVLDTLKKDPPGADLLANMTHVVRAIESSMDGTSGAMYAIFLNSLVHNLRQLDTGSSIEATAQLWAKALQGALAAISSYTPAKVGDRTMMDALIPFVDALHGSGKLSDAVTAAEQGAASTKGMKASLGRTVYVGGESYKEVPDPGAHGLAVLFRGMADAA